MCAGSVACFEQATQRGALGRALRRSLTTDEIEALRARLYGAAPGGAEQR